MREEKLLTVRETAQILNITERAVMDLAQEGKIPAYKVGGVYVRFRREQIETFKKQAIIPDQGKSDHLDYPLRERISDFFYFNDFYIAAALLILWMLILIIRF
jgi:excisionase family DNA binding protein